MTSNPCAKIVDKPEKARERYLTSHEEARLAETMTDDLAFLRLPFRSSGERPGRPVPHLSLIDLSTSLYW